MHLWTVIFKTWPRLGLHVCISKTIQDLRQNNFDRKIHLDSVFKGLNLRPLSGQSTAQALTVWVHSGQTIVWSIHGPCLYCVGTFRADRCLVNPRPTPLLCGYIQGKPLSGQSTVPLYCVGTFRADHGLVNPRPMPLLCGYIQGRPWSGQSTTHAFTVWVHSGQTIILSIHGPRLYCVGTFRADHGLVNPRPTPLLCGYIQGRPLSGQSTAHAFTVWVHSGQTIVWSIHGPGLYCVGTFRADHCLVNPRLTPLLCGYIQGRPLSGQSTAHAFTVWVHSGQIIVWSIHSPRLYCVGTFRADHGLVNPRPTPLLCGYIQGRPLSGQSTAHAFTVWVHSGQTIVWSIHGSRLYCMGTFRADHCLVNPRPTPLLCGYIQGRPLSGQSTAHAFTVWVHSGQSMVWSIYGPRLYCVGTFRADHCLVNPWLMPLLCGYIQGRPWSGQSTAHAFTVWVHSGQTIVWSIHGPCLYCVGTFRAIHGLVNLRPTPLLCGYIQGRPLSGQSTAHTFTVWVHSGQTMVWSIHGPRLYCVGTFRADNCLVNPRPMPLLCGYIQGRPLSGQSTAHAFTVWVHSGQTIVWSIHGSRLYCVSTFRADHCLVNSWLTPLLYEYIQGRPLSGQSTAHAFTVWVHSGQTIVWSIHGPCLYRAGTFRADHCLVIHGSRLYCVGTFRADHCLVNSRLTPLLCEYIQGRPLSGQSTAHAFTVWVHSGQTIVWSIHGPRLYCVGTFRADHGLVNPRLTPLPCGYIQGRPLSGQSTAQAFTVWVHSGQAIVWSIHCSRLYCVGTLRADHGLVNPRPRLYCVGTLRADHCLVNPRPTPLLCGYIQGRPLSGQSTARAFTVWVHSGQTMVWSIHGPRLYCVGPVRADHGLVNPRPTPLLCGCIQGRSLSGQSTAHAFTVWVHSGQTMVWSIHGPCLYCVGPFRADHCLVNPRLTPLLYGYIQGRPLSGQSTAHPFTVWVHSGQTIVWSIHGPRLYCVGTFRADHCLVNPRLTPLLCGYIQGRPLFGQSTAHAFSVWVHSGQTIVWSIHGPCLYCVGTFRADHCLVNPRLMPLLCGYIQGRPLSGQSTAHAFTVWVHSGQTIVWSIHGPRLYCVGTFRADHGLVNPWPTPLLCGYIQGRPLSGQSTAHAFTVWVHSGQTIVWSIHGPCLYCVGTFRADHCLVNPWLTPLLCGYIQGRSWSGQSMAHAFTVWVHSGQTIVWSIHGPRLYCVGTFRADHGLVNPRPMPLLCGYIQGRPLSGQSTAHAFTVWVHSGQTIVWSIHGPCLHRVGTFRADHCLVNTRPTPLLCGYIQGRPLSGQSTAHAFTVWVHSGQTIVWSIHGPCLYCVGTFRADYCLVNPRLTPLLCGYIQGRPLSGQSTAHAFTVWVHSGQTIVWSIHGPCLYCVGTFRADYCLVNPRLTPLLCGYIQGRLLFGQSTAHAFTVWVHSGQTIVWSIHGSRLYCAGTFRAAHCLVNPRLTSLLCGYIQGRLLSGQSTAHAFTVWVHSGQIIVWSIHGSCLYCAGTFRADHCLVNPRPTPLLCGYIQGRLLFGQSTAHAFTVWVHSRLRYLQL